MPADAGGELAMYKHLSVLQIIDVARFIFVNVLNVLFLSYCGSFFVQGAWAVTGYCTCETIYRITFRKQT